MARTDRPTFWPVTRAPGTVNEYVPSSRVVVPRPMPSRKTLANDTGAPASLLIVPLSVAPCCALAGSARRADASAVPTTRKNRDIRGKPPENDDARFRGEGNEPERTTSSQIGGGTSRQKRSEERTSELQRGR